MGSKNASFEEKKMKRGFLFVNSDAHREEHLLPDTEFLIRIINAYLKFVDAACKVLALMLEKVSDFSVCFILKCYRHIFFPWALAA